MSKARRAASCAAVIGIAIVGCGSGPSHGRSASDSSGVVGAARLQLRRPRLIRAAPPPVVGERLRIGRGPPRHRRRQHKPSPPSSASNALAGTAAAFAKDHWSTLPARADCRAQRPGKRLDGPATSDLGRRPRSARRPIRRRRRGVRPDDEAVDEASGRSHQCAHPDGQRLDGQRTLHLGR